MEEVPISFLLFLFISSIINVGEGRMHVELFTELMHISDCITAVINELPQMPIPVL